jgi:bifunctional non-homologous end joining protein LigD
MAEGNIGAAGLPGIQVATYLDTEGIAFFKAVKAKGIEGIVANGKNSIYRPGKRTSDWLKIKSRPQQDFVVGGFTEGQQSETPKLPLEVQT